MIAAVSTEYKQWEILASVIVAMIVATPPMLISVKMLRENRRQHGQVADTVSDNSVALIQLQHQIDGIDDTLSNHVATDRAKLDDIAASLQAHIEWAAVNVVVKTDPGLELRRDLPA